jgi:hypothetical protein
MAKRRLIRRSLAFAFTLTLASVASARRPPALAEVQGDADRVFATCPQSHARDTSGYRDMLARVPSAIPVTRAIAAAPLPPPRKMGDHLVLVCAGGEIHQGSGYREFPLRFPAEPTGPQLAGTPRLLGRR